MQKRYTEVVWTRQETIPSLCRKTDTGDGTVWEKMKRTKAERWMAVSSVKRGMRAIGATEDEVHNRTGSRGIVPAAAIPQISGSS